MSRRGGRTSLSFGRVSSATDLDVADLATVLEDVARMSVRLPTSQRLSFTTLSVLHTLARCGPRRLIALAADEHVTQSAVTQIVTRLERDGLVERQSDPSDGRAVLVHVTGAGAAIVDGRHAERIARLTDVTGRLAPAEREALAAALPALSHLAALHRAAEG